MSNEMVSIIVPIYNSEQYLETCLDSILAQTYTNLDIILVDDGSTDASGAICDAYAGKDHRIRVFHNTNHGVSYSRNCGIKAAKGEYLLFIDSDDFINKAYVERLLIKAARYDLAIGGIYDIGENLENAILRKVPDIRSGIIAKDFYEIFNFLRVMCAKMYKKDIIDGNFIRFREDVNFGEDQLFNYEYYKNSKTYAFSVDSKYFYRHRNNHSLSYSGYKSEKIYLIKMLIDELKECLRAINAKDKNECLNEYFFLYLPQVNNGYFFYKRKCNMIRSYLGNNLEISSWKRKLVLICIKHQIYSLIYLYYRIKYLLHR